MAKRDYYAVLGVSRDATAEQIRSAYRKLARKFHPDVNRDDPKAEEKFKEVQEAYDVLADKQKRSAYDQFGFAGIGAGGPPGGWQGGPGGGYRRTWTTGGFPGGAVDFDLGNLGDLFEMFGGGRAARAAGPRGRARRAERGADLEHELELSFEEAALGCARELRLAGPDGEQKLSVKIPAGIAEGGRIRLRGKGRPGVGGPGDLLVTIRVRPHAFFRRDGLDVILEAPVTAAEAALGAKIDVPTLKGKVALTIPPGAAAGGRLRLKGLGIRHEKTGRHGDQYVVVRVVLPGELDEQSRRLLQEFDRRNPLQPRKDLGW